MKYELNDKEYETLVEAEKILFKMITEMNRTENHTCICPFGKYQTVQTHNLMIASSVLLSVKNITELK